MSPMNGSFNGNGSPAPRYRTRSAARKAQLDASAESDGIAADSHAPTNGHSPNKLDVPSPTPAWKRAVSRSPSPLGLIPIHRTFSSLVCSPFDLLRSSIPSRSFPGSNTPTTPTISTTFNPKSPKRMNSKLTMSVLSQIHKHEVPRKLLHVSIGGLVVYLYRNGFQPADITPWLAGALVPIATADVLRFWSPRFNALYIRVLGALMRESEVKGWNGVVWYLVGTLTVLTVFPKDVATLSIIILSWCDTAASTFGRLYGRYTPSIRRGKSLAGCVASFVVATASAAYFYGMLVPSTPDFPNDPPNKLMWTGRLGLPSTGYVTGGAALALGSLWAGLAGSFSEVVDIWGLDDNVIIPILSAVGIWGFFKILS